MQPVATELLRDLATVLRGMGVRWYVFGAQAVVVHGFVRQTADVDVTVELPPGGLAALLKQLAARGFRVRLAEDVEAFVNRTRVLPLVHQASRLPLDLVLAGPGLEEGFLERAVEVSVRGTRFPVISAEDLIVVKLLAGRAKDVDDVRGVLLRKRGKMDLAAVRTRLAELEQLLDRSDLVPQFEELLARLTAKR